MVDINKKEIYDTWKPGTDSDNNEVWDIDVEIGYDKIYAATSNGIYSANLSDAGLSYFGNWTINDDLPVPKGKYTSVLFTNSKLYVNRSSQLSAGDSIYVIGSDCTLFSYIPGVINTSFDPANDGFTVSSTGAVKYYYSDGSLKKTISTYGWGTPNIVQALEDNGDIWIADILRRSCSVGTDMSDFTLLTFPGPASNNAISITSLNGQTIICGGSVDNSWNNQWLYHRSPYMKTIAGHSCHQPRFGML